MSSRGIVKKDDANFTPALGEYKDLRPFRFWCQKVLPLVYDDSLSYYELLCKVIDYLNKTMEDVGVLEGDVTGLHEAYVKLQSWVNDYFSTLDIQEEINNKLDELVNSGRLDVMLSIFIPYVTLEMFGGVGDGVNDDTQALKKAIENSYETGRAIIVTEKNFLITETINITDSVVIMSISNKKYDHSNNDLNYNFIFTGDGYLFNINNDVPFNTFYNLSIKGNGKNRCFYINSHRNSFLKLYLNNFNTCFLITQNGNIKTIENKISNCFFENNDTVLRSIFNTGSATDGYFENNIIINGSYSIQADVLSQWLIFNNHDYSERGISIAQAINLNIINNYFDNTNKTSIYLLLNGICNISGNQFLCQKNGDCYKIRLTTQSGYEYSSCSITGNTMTKTGKITGNWYLVWANVSVSLAGNNSFQEYNLLYPETYHNIEPPLNSLKSQSDTLTSNFDITNCKVIKVMDKLKHIHLDITLTSDVEPYTEIVALNNLFDVGFNQHITVSGFTLICLNKNTSLVSNTKLPSGTRLLGDFTILG